MHLDIPGWKNFFGGLTPHAPNTLSNPVRHGQIMGAEIPIVMEMNIA